MHLDEILRDFGEMVRQHGLAKVIEAMDEETFWTLYNWFSNVIEGGRRTD